MADEKTQPKIEQKKEEAKIEHKPAEHKHTLQNAIADNSKDASKETPKAEEKKEAKKPEVKKTKKEEAVARGSNLPISKKQSMAIGRFIKGKTIDSAISLLQEVIKFKKPVPFTGEIPHRSYPGVMSGRYPISASKHFINVLKALKGNSLVNGLDLEKVRIFSLSPSWASRPQKKGGARFKRVNLVITAREIKESKSEKKENKEAKK